MPPGFRYPHSHNLIESMSVGAIPITNYGHLFDPPLVHGHTCLRFATTKDLHEALRQAMNMPADALAQLRENVVRHYDDHLAPESLFARLREYVSGMTTLHVLNEGSLEPPHVWSSEAVPHDA